MKVQNRDFKYIATPRLLRLFKRFRERRPMASATTKKKPA